MRPGAMSLCPVTATIGYWPFSSASSDPNVHSTVASRMANGWAKERNSKMRMMKRTRIIMTIIAAIVK